MAVDQDRVGHLFDQPQDATAVFLNGAERRGSMHALGCLTLVSVYPHALTIESWARRAHRACSLLFGLDGQCMWGL